MQAANTISQVEHVGASGAPVTVLHIVGDVSSNSKEIILNTFASLTSVSVQNILLDFKQVAYLNSSGIAIVIQVLIASRKASQTVAICGLTPHFTKVFTMVGITKYTTLHADEASALASF